MWFHSHAAWFTFPYHSRADGEWDWDNYSLLVLTQRRDIPASAVAVVKYNIWCAIGNTVHVVQPGLIKMEVGGTCCHGHCMYKSAW